MKHRMVTIGWLGDKHCYLDISREEALARYQVQEGSAADDDMVTEFEFDDEFGAYDAYDNGK